MPRLLTDNQKENRAEISQVLLADANGNKNFLKNIVTVDGERVSSTKKHRGVGQRSGDVCCFLMGKALSIMNLYCTTWSDGKQTLYQEVLAHLRDAVCRKRPELW